MSSRFFVTPGKKFPDFYHILPKSSNFHVINFKLPRKGLRGDKSFGNGSSERYLFPLRSTITLLNNIP